MFSVNADFRIKWETGYNFCWESLSGKIVPGLVLVLCCVWGKSGETQIAIVASEKARLTMFWSTAAWSPVYWLFMWEFSMCFPSCNNIWIFPYNIYFFCVTESQLLRRRKSMAFSDGRAAAAFGGRFSQRLSLKPFLSLKLSGSRSQRLSPNPFLSLKLSGSRSLRLSLNPFFSLKLSGSRSQRLTLKLSNFYTLTEADRVLSLKQSKWKWKREPAMYFLSEKTRES